MLFRMLINKETLSQQALMTERKTKPYCKPILEALNDDKSCQELFKRTTETWIKSGLDIDDKELVKQSNTTKMLQSLV